MLSQIIKKVGRLVNPKIDIADEYTEWLCFANAGMLNRGNLYCFNHAIENLPSDNPIIEIGSFCGLSTNIINYYLRKHEKINSLITSDKWIFEGSEQGGQLGSDKMITHKEYREFVKETYQRNVSFFSKDNLPYTIEVFSDEFFQLWQDAVKTSDVFGRKITLGGKISFCYIDGNHSYEYARRDFINTDKFLEQGGFILFDDSSDRQDLGSSKLMKEILCDDRYELVCKNPNYLFRKK